MLTTRTPVTAAAVKRATEGRDARALSAFYADDAVIRIIDRANPPSRPREVRGKQEISAFWEDVCGRSMTHAVEATAAEGERLAFTEACTYPDGTKVLCIAMADLKDGIIARQTIVQAWDE
ncbi:nuclear transport factor 2 family protein [Nitratireductor luteus]|uniref:nuclear transport factor 2 family protein n=1 Tax=Nitratireductor luteus TaxID=2976980 RepID=UPI00223FDC1B|nr:nuclear transport factor 2 family protein [Nitratireductor luteus]